MFNTCNHDWEVKSTVVLPSAFEQMGKATNRSCSAPYWVFQKKAVVIMACKKCGKIDKTTLES